MASSPLTALSGTLNRSGSFLPIVLRSAHNRNRPVPSPASSPPDRIRGMRRERKTPLLWVLCKDRYTLEPPCAADSPTVRHPIGALRRQRPRNKKAQGIDW